MIGNIIYYLHKNALLLFNHHQLGKKEKENSELDFNIIYRQLKSLANWLIKSRSHISGFDFEIVLYQYE